MRALTLNLFTVAVTAVILAVLALPAKDVLDGSGAAGSAAAEPVLPHPPPAQHPRRVFGAYVDPWHVDDWARAIGAAPQAIAKFESFSRNRTLSEWQDEATRQGVRRMLVSWEPWAPVPVALGLEAQAKSQPGYRNIDIARGAHDRYIMRFARSLARFDGTVYLRYAHEMNGYWYPWSRGARSYRWAWRRIVRLFDVAGADNVRFVWSVNPNLYESEEVWMANARRYWPGSRYVDYVASTVIDFGGSKDYPIRRFVPRLEALRGGFGKPIVLAETNTEWRGRLVWLRDLRRMLRDMPWIRAVMWSQLPSRGAAHRATDGIVDWDIQRDPVAAGALRNIVLDGAR
jgi:mannan endo-1,4-beta-mannosidase